MASGPLQVASPCSVPHEFCWLWWAVQVSCRSGSDVVLARSGSGSDFVGGPQ